MKRVLAALLAGLMTFGVAYGLAASLNLTGDSLGAGTATVAACQAGTLDASYATSYSASAPGYAVGTVTITGLTSACYGMAYRITLSGAEGTSLGEVSGTTPTSGTNFSATFSPAVAAASVTGISVVISG